MQGSITLTKALSDCKVGEEKEITLLVTPTSNDSEGFKADVVKVVDYEEEMDEEEKKPMMEGKEMGKLAPAAKKAMRYS